MTMKTQIAIVGGTHGNEVTGVRLIERLRANPQIVERETLSTQLVIGNPVAVQQCVRYVDEDLNRGFAIAELNREPAATREAQRAHELNNLLGPKLNKPKTDVLLDLHTTTADMGVTLIVYDNPFNLGIAGYIQKQITDVSIYISDKKYEDTIGLQSIAPCSMLVEIGPIAPGVLRHDIFEQMDEVVRHALDYIDMVNRSPEKTFHGNLDVFQRGKLIEYPSDDDGNITAMIHKDLQNANYQELKPGSPLFITYNGDVILYDGEPGWYPVFINEAAYYEKTMALRLNRKLQIRV